MKTKTLLLLSLLSAAGWAAPDGKYSEVIRETASMVSDASAQKIARSHGLQILNVTWEDTGRYKGSSVGPNISDMTLQIQEENRVTCLPVIRFPNFEDKSADLRLENFHILVGNEKGRFLRKISLRDYLDDFRGNLHDPNSWKGNRQSLLSDRDRHVLVSAQACFLPIPKKGQAQFNPVLFNYQSYKDNPAVLTLVCTREGTSATVIDNTRDGFTSGRGVWGQRLFFNQDGERASFTGKRLSDYVADGGDGNDHTPSAGQQQGMNMVLLVQVPLVHKPIARFEGMMNCDAATTCKGERSRAGSDVENAVVGHGKVEGPFTEIDNLAIERDPKYPIRVTVQFYKATSNGVVNEKDLAGIASQINQVYADGDYVGSLVTGGESGRPTEFTGNKVQPKGWWGQFWKQYDQKLGPRSMFNFFRDFNA
ncbi:hypothetical protein IV102_03685 [bacterium]|nr:hypothetical protein [bacterium]